MVLSPLADKLGFLSNPEESRKQFFSLLDRNLIDISLDDHQKCLHAVEKQQRAVFSKVVPEISPGRCPQSSRSRFGKVGLKQNLMRVIQVALLKNIVSLCPLKI